MSQVNVVRAWKDEEYRRGLTEAERAGLPDNPAEFLEQTEAELEQAVGGGIPVHTIADCVYYLTPTNWTIVNTAGGCPSVACTPQTFQTSVQYSIGY